MAPRRDAIRETLRQRIRRALDTGAVRGGDRLPSTREAAAELRADPRVVAAAYRQLADEGLVELRPRAGVFVAGLPDVAPPTAPRAWLAQVVAEGVARGVSTAELVPQLHAAVATREARAVVVATTDDQAAGLARELRDDLGMHATVVLADEVRAGVPVPRAVQRAHVVVTTEAHERPMRALAERLGKRLVAISVRPDLVAREYAALLRGATTVVVSDPRFAALLREYLRALPAAERVRILVVGRDDVASIPETAVTYVTQAARARLGRTRLPGRVLPPARTLSEDCVRELARVLVDVNLGPR